MNQSLQTAPILCLMLLAAAGVRADYTFTTIDYPDVVLYTETFGNSNAGHVAGEYRDPFGTARAYVLSNGSFESFDYPGSIGTSALDVNSAGDSAGIFGEYLTGYTKAFRRVAGSITELVPASGSTYTQAGGINDAGHIVGSYYVNNLDRGFIFDGTTYTTGLNAPGAMHTVPCGLNSSDWIVGDYTTPSGFVHGFRLVGGNYTIIDYPGASFTRANDVNDSGQIAGFYHDAAGGTHGFVRSSAGVYTKVDLPGSTMTQIRGINNSGEVSGYYNDVNGVAHGFVGVPPAAGPDFNGNHVADAADYVVWRKQNGSEDDYLLWRSNFGQTINGGAGLSSFNVASTIPEPATIFLAGVAICGCLAYGRHSRTN